MSGEAARRAATSGPVHIVGAGLIGASIGLALRGFDVDVTLEDASTTSMAVAEHVGAGRQRQAADPAPALVVVAVPPDVTAAVVGAQLERFPQATVMDTASVKKVVAEELRQAGAPLERYVGSHPMAGRERSGAAAASADLFTGRPWVVVATAETGWEAQRCARDLATDLGAGLVQLDAEAHDQAVALVSHVPQVLSSLVAARLAAAPEGALDLAGQGLRDTTRIAASDPNLWAAILAGNGPAVAEVLRAVAADLDRALAALEGGASPDNLGKAVVALTDLIAAGNAGVRRIPGKHGGAKRRFDKVTVMVPDQPGELGRLFQEMGRLGVNLEDLRLEHGAGQLVGMAEISVAEGAGAKLMEDLETQGWRILR